MLKNGAIFNRDAFDLIAQLKKKKIKNFMVTGSVKAELLLEYANKDDLLEIYSTGVGKIKIRGKAEIEKIIEDYGKLGITI